MILAACIVAYLVIGAVIAGLLRRFEVLVYRESEDDAVVWVTLLWPMASAVLVLFLVLAGVCVLVDATLGRLYRWIGGAS